MRWLLAVALGLALGPTGAEAADWGGISPGRSNMNDARAVHGAPSKTAVQKVDGYDGQQWTYEGQRAPTGISRMVIDFGMLVGGTFRADVVRALTLEPKPLIFNVDIVLQGWGIPEREAPPGQPIAFFYDSGLLVNFHEDGRTVKSLVFTPAQVPTPASGSAPPRR